MSLDNSIPTRWHALLRRKRSRGSALGDDLQGDVMTELFDGSLARFAPIFGEQQIFHKLLLGTSCLWLWVIAIHPPVFFQDVLAELFKTHDHSTLKLVMLTFAICGLSVLVAYWSAESLKRNDKVIDLIFGAVSGGPTQLKDMDAFAWSVCTFFPMVWVPAFFCPPVSMLCAGHLTMHHIILIQFSAILPLSFLVCSFWAVYGMVLVVWKASVVQTLSFLDKMAVLQPLDDLVGGAQQVFKTEKVLWVFSTVVQVRVALKEVRRPGAQDSLGSALLGDQPNEEKDVCWWTQEQYEKNAEEYWQNLGREFQTLRRLLLAAWTLTAVPLYACLSVFATSALVAFLMAMTTKEKLIETCGFTWVAASLLGGLLLLWPLARVNTLFESENSLSIHLLARLHLGQVPTVAVARYAAFCEAIQHTQGGVSLLFVGVVSFAKLSRIAAALGTILPTMLTLAINAINNSDDSLHGNNTGIST